MISHASLLYPVISATCSHPDPEADCTALSNHFFLASYLKSHQLNNRTFHTGEVVQLFVIAFVKYSYFVVVLGTFHSFFFAISYIPSLHLLIKYEISDLSLSDIFADKLFSYWEIYFWISVILFFSINSLSFIDHSSDERWLNHDCNLNFNSLPITFHAFDNASPYFLSFKSSPISFNHSWSGSIKSFFSVIDFTIVLTTADSCVSFFKSSSLSFMTEISFCCSMVSSFGVSTVLEFSNLSDI